jgi:hypothetical protein
MMLMDPKHGEEMRVSKVPAIDPRLYDLRSQGLGHCSFAFLAEPGF